MIYLLNKLKLENTHFFVNYKINESASVLQMFLNEKQRKFEAVFRYSQQHLRVMRVTLVAKVQIHLQHPNKSQTAE